MTMSATLSVVGPVIANKPATCILTVSNSGVDAVKVYSIQPKVQPVGMPVTVTPPTVTPQQAVATTTGTQQQVSVPGAGSVNFTFTMVVMSGAVQTGLPQQGGLNFTIGADVTASDSTLFAPVPQAVAVALPQFGLPGSGSPNISATRGELQFNLATNGALAL